MYSYHLILSLFYVLYSLILPFPSNSLVSHAVFSATQCLDTMATVVEVCKDDANAISKLETLVAPLVYKIFSSGDEAIEYVDNAIELIGLLSYYPETISETLWQCFGPMLEAVDDWAWDYMMEFSSPITNFIAKGTAIFLQGNYNGKSFLDVVLALCQKAIEHDTSEYEREAKSAGTILNCIVVCCKGGGYTIDPIIAPIMELVISRLPHCKSFGLRSRLLCTAMGVVVYNPEGACEFYRNVPEVEALVFETLFTSLPRIYRSSQQQVCIAAFSSLLALPPASLPTYLQSNVQALMTFSIRLISLLEENDEEEGDYEDEEGEEEEEEEEEVSSPPKHNICGVVLSLFLYRRVHLFYFCKQVTSFSFSWIFVTP